LARAVNPDRASVRGSVRLELAAQISPRAIFRRHQTANASKTAGLCAASFRAQNRTPKKPAFLVLFPSARFL
jgi:hypothetical protein